MRHTPSTEKLIADLTFALTCTTFNGTSLVQDQLQVDATARKLVERLKALEYEKRRTEAEIQSIRDALKVAGVKIEPIQKEMFAQEHFYVSAHVFEAQSLRECCEQILEDHPGQWFSKSDIEYLIVRGGYKFNGDAKNSVAVTLQRMKADGRCRVVRGSGARGNRYSWPQPLERSTDAASTKRKRK
jgi:hypothetical protein